MGSHGGIPFGSTREVTEFQPVIFVEKWYLFVWSETLISNNPGFGNVDLVMLQIFVYYKLIGMFTDNAHQWHLGALSLDTSTINPNMSMEDAAGWNTRWCTISSPTWQLIQLDFMTTICHAISMVNRVYEPTYSMFWGPGATLFANCDRQSGAAATISGEQTTD